MEDFKKGLAEKFKSIEKLSLKYDECEKVESKRPPPNE
jgi:hypothetical protein